MPTISQKFISWEAREYHFERKSRDWYGAFWIVAVAMAIAAVLFKSYIFGIFILVAAFTLSLFASRPPSTFRCEVNEKGIVVHKNFYPYDTLESFGIDIESPNIPKLLVKSKKMLMPYIIVPLENINIDEVKLFLERYLVNENHREPVSHKIMEYLGF